MGARWQCEYVNAKGIRCTVEAVYRIQYSYFHPFDHMDVCEEHLKEYPKFNWIQRLKAFEEEKNELPQSE